MKLLAESNVVADRVSFQSMTFFIITVKSYLISHISMFRTVTELAISIMMQSQCLNGFREINSVCRRQYMKSNIKLHSFILQMRNHNTWTLSFNSQKFYIVLFNECWQAILFLFFVCFIVLMLSKINQWISMY